jgi:hypothetical protein
MARWSRRLLAASTVAAGATAAGDVGLVTGACPLDLGIGRRARPLGPQLVEVAAPREAVFDLIAEPYLGRTPRALADKVRVLERGSDMVLAAHVTPLGGAAGAGCPDGGDGALHPTRAGRLPAGPRTGPACGRGVHAGGAARWCRHAAGLPGAARRRPVAPGPVVEPAGRRSLGADGRDLAGSGQGRSRTAPVEGGTLALQPRPTAPNYRSIAAEAKLPCNHRLAGHPSRPVGEFGNLLVHRGSAHTQQPRDRDDAVARAGCAGRGHDYCQPRWEFSWRCGPGADGGR